MNKLYQQMQTQGLKQNLLSNSNLTNIKQMMNMFKGASNPRQLLNNMMAQNPQMKQAMDLINMSGKDPRTLFYEMADKQGVDPEQILQMLK